jgi:hypothetical protein
MKKAQGREGGRENLTGEKRRTAEKRRHGRRGEGRSRSLADDGDVDGDQGGHLHLRLPAKTQASRGNVSQLSAPGHENLAEGVGSERKRRSKGGGTNRRRSRRHRRSWPAGEAEVTADRAVVDEAKKRTKER